MSTQDHITITSLPSEKVSKNYDSLRKEGIEYLQKVVGKIWTDFNPHDPGVTILEELCYAITDLGYRTNLDIQDLLAVNEQDENASNLNNFFTAREILTNAPYTQNDYRKLMIDVDGIKNAWFDKTTVAEIDFYADLVNKELTYIAEPDAKKINLNGLYEVLVEFDESENYGDLNDNTIALEYAVLEEELKGLRLEITAEFPYWSDDLGPGFSWSSLTDIQAKIRTLTVQFLKKVKGFEIQISIDVDNQISVAIVDTTKAPYTDKPDLAAALKAELDALVDPLNTEGENLLILQQEKVAETEAIVQKAKDRVHENRNLCEDFVRFNTLKIEEILLCADIEIAPEKDTEEILAEIYFQIGLFLAPTIKFYSFAEMLEKGYETVDIFEGPRLDHGFIDSAELEISSRRKSIHVSDLINIIMDIDGVIAIKEIQIANFALGDSSVLSKSVHWCLELAYEKNFVPRLSPEKSKITFIKKGIPFTANQEEAEDLLDAKKAELRIATNVYHDLDLEIPNGTYYRLEDYTSIQVDFPTNYGIGEIGLSSSVSDLRKAQAKQLKGFLLFFDQLLANYCAQLANVKSLFSMNSDIDRTYFNQALYKVPNIDDLYTEFIDFAGLSNNPGKDNKSTKTSDWKAFTKAFTSEVDKNGHQQKLDTITESETDFYQRRNKFLDHLLARFSEQFADYAMLAYTIEGKKEQKEMIKDKLSFLQDYPTLSYERGQAFNYKTESWETDNCSGLEKRVSRLLGIDRYDRRDLACPPIESSFDIYKDVSDKYRFRFRNSNGDILLKSQAYVSNATRQIGINSVMLNGTDPENYVLIKTAGGKFYYNLKAQNGEIIGTSNFYSTQENRDNALEQLVTQLNGECNGEGFYLLEHILLRPRTVNDDFLPVSFKEDCYCQGNEDVYSFRATCIMPFWIGRFKNMDFRNFVERTIREEAPAHIFMKICWIDSIQMAAFQEAYKAWLDALKNAEDDQPTLTLKQNELITVLNTLRNIYPVSYLYDCQETENTPIRLGQSILGTFTPKENE